MAASPGCTGDGETFRQSTAPGRAPASFYRHRARPRSAGVPHTAARQSPGPALPAYRPGRSTDLREAAPPGGPPRQRPGWSYRRRPLRVPPIAPRTSSPFYAAPRWAGYIRLRARNDLKPSRRALLGHISCPARAEFSEEVSPMDVRSFVLALAGLFALIIAIAIFKRSQRETP